MSAVNYSRKGGVAWQIQINSESFLAEPRVLGRRQLVLPEVCRQLCATPLWGRGGKLRGCVTQWFLKSKSISQHTGPSILSKEMLSRQLESKSVKIEAHYQKLAGPTGVRIRRDLFCYNYCISVLANAGVWKVEASYAGVADRWDRVIKPSSTPTVESNT